MHCVDPQAMRDRAMIIYDIVSLIKGDREVLLSCFSGPVYSTAPKQSHWHDCRGSELCHWCKNKKQEPLKSTLLPEKI